MTPELCCNPPPHGNADCWDGEYTYERCCGEWKPGTPSKEVESLKIDPTSVPSIRLLDGGSMPMAGVGLCCRPSAQGDAVRQGVLDFLLLGGRHLDDAKLYNNHREVGQGIREAMSLGVPREDIFLTTKIWNSDFGFEATKDWVSTSLEELGLDYIDLVLLHLAKVGDGLACGSGTQCRQETWLALMLAQAQGKIKHLGVSNFGARQMQEILDLKGSPIVANQFEYHPWIVQKHRETVDWCHQQGIVVTGYGSMGGSQLVEQLMSQGILQDIGKRHGKTVGQVLLRWSLQKNITVIPGTSNPKHQAENLQVFDFALSDEEMAMLDNVPEDQHMNLYGHVPDRDL